MEDFQNFDIFNYLFSDSKSNDIELTQYLSPVLFFGPSSKTWPKCPSQFAHSISVLGRPKIELSSLYIIASSLTASKKLGQPQPASYFDSDLNNSALQFLHLYTPSSKNVSNSPENGLSVPLSFKT